MKEKIRVYLVNDDYKTVYYTDNALEYYQELMKYINTLATSKKENSYYLKSWFTTKDEYEVFKKNQQLKDTEFNKIQEQVKIKKEKLPKLTLIKNETPQTSSDKPKAKLHLVD